MTRLLLLRNSTAPAFTVKVGGFVTAPAASTSVDVPYPAGLAAGDRLIAVFLGSTTVSVGTPPAGWAVDTVSTAPINIRVTSVLGPAATGSESGTLAFPIDASNMSAQMFAVTGVDSTTPLDVASGAANSGSAGFLVLPSVTAATAGASPLFMAASSVAATTFTGPAGSTELADWGETGGNSRGFGLYQDTTPLAAAGASGTRQINLSPSRPTAGIIMLLRPVVAPKLSTLVDDFNAGSLNPVFTRFGSSSSVVAGRLRVPNTLNVSSGVYTARAYDFTNSEASIESVTLDTTTGTASYPILLESVDDRLMFFIQDGFTYCIWDRPSLGGAHQGTTTSTTYSATNHKFFRLREASGTTYWETSPNRTTWTVLRQVATPANFSTGLTNFVIGGDRSGAGTDSFNAYDDLNTASSGFVGTATLSGSGTLSAATTPRPTQTANLSGSGTLSTTQIPRPARAVALSGSGTLATAQTPRPAPSVSLSGSGTLSTTQVPAVPGAAALSGSGTLTASGTAAGGNNFTGTAALSGSGTLTGAATPRPSRTVALSGSGSLTTTRTVGVSATATLTGSGTLTTVTRPGLGAPAALSGSGTLTASGSAAGGNNFTGVATLSGSGSLTTTGALTATGTATLSGSGTLNAAPPPTGPPGIRHILIDAADQPRGRVHVRARLLTVPAYLNGGGEVVAPYETYTGPDGMFVLPLASDLPDALYEVTWPGARRLITVPDDGTHWLHDVEV